MCSNRRCGEKQNTHFASYKMFHLSDIYYRKVGERPGFVARCLPLDIYELSRELRVLFCFRPL